MASSEQIESLGTAVQDVRPPSIVYGPSAPVPLTMTFAQLLDHNAEIRGDRPAVISHPQKGLTLSWAQLRERSIKLARSMAKDGIGNGDLVAISLGSRVEYFETFFACTRLGAALVLLNYAYAESEMLALLKIVRPKMMVTSPGFTFYDNTKVLPKIAEEIPSIAKFLIMDDLAQKYTLSGPLARSAKYEEYIEQFEADAQQLSEVNISPHDMVNVQFTSGSTGLPKSVALSHYNIMNCGRYIWQQTRMTDRDRICLPVPLFHSFGMIVGISSSTVGGSALVLPHEIFNSSATLRSIQTYQCTAIYGVPTMFVTEMELKELDSIDRSTIKFGIIAGAAMPPELLRRIVTKFPVPRLYTCWGMTELSSFVSMMHETDPYEKRIKTAGRLFPHFIAKIVKPDTGIVLPWGEKGEIVASGYGQMSEYLNNKKKTDETLKYHPEDLETGGVGGLGDGTVLRKWMHTGDEGYLDPEGYFIISGRIKDLIIRGGENISPMEIEDRLIEHESVAQASIVGVPDDKYGEELGAFIELRDGFSEKCPSEDDLRAFVREKLARFKAPRYFFWLGDGKAPDKWPQTTSGKISKPDLRKLVDILVKR
ncbi:Putative AMP-dependent synthetase/ligase, AMP-binding, AMP-binding enzyme domain, ANL [Septoria linicola]|uniref:AMP-dependent synthetase/ligase, AMP-binding, AMP-binding enzyme domain, ANL n=1 Tax=Septoria linicola TaxID=215465 RepID=A0A9Q9ELA8_9PEZI|nr:putative AMP-dependent synthetase/ligase, AMP-binding, AMP-binding enzyme domain, ANL [Septoria linicola]USW53253.1 Putative AMP-dependent synthetase/ligase, AMP-binding, AMP-binding enzyme domain, ANL [Septoria linicola]